MEGSMAKGPTDEDKSKIGEEITRDALERLEGVGNQRHNRFVVAVEAEKVLVEERLRRLEVGVTNPVVTAEAEKMLIEERLRRLDGISNQTHNRFVVAVEAEKTLTEERLKRLSGVANQMHNRFVTALEAEKTLIEERIKKLKES
jgi:hypothetical protein